MRSQQIPSTAGSEQRQNSQKLSNHPVLAQAPVFQQPQFHPHIYPIQEAPSFVHPPLFPSINPYQAQQPFSGYQAQQQQAQQEKQQFNAASPHPSLVYPQSHPYFYGQPHYYMPYAPQPAAMPVYPQQTPFYIPHSPSAPQFSHPIPHYHPAPYGMPLFASPYYPPQYPPQILPIQESQHEIFQNFGIEQTSRQSIRSTQAITTPWQSTPSMSLNQSNITQEAMPLTYKNTSCEVQLRVNCTTNLNQRVAVVGSVPDLGAWEVSRALLMSTDLDSYPNWTCHFYVDEMTVTIEYKFVKLTTQPDGQVEIEWEEIAANRSLDVNQRKNVLVEYSFGQQEKRKEDFVKRDRKPVEAPVNLEPFVQTSSPLSVVSPSYQITPKTYQEEKSPSSTILLSKTEEFKVPDFENISLKISRQPQYSAESENLDSVGPETEDFKGKAAYSRQQIRKQLQDAFPSEKSDLKKEKTDKNRVMRRAGVDSDIVSSASNTQDGSRTSTLGGLPKKNILITKDPNPKTLKLDPKECIVQVSHQLPYSLVSREEGQFVVEPSYPAPSLLYANLDELGKTNTYNFVWVGIVVTKHLMTSFEEEQANKLLAEMNCFAIFFTEEQITPYLRFYEGLIRPNMHNFVDPSDHQKQALNYWNEFKSINSRIARRVQEVRRQVNSHTVWIHGDQNMLVPYYIRQSEKVKANIGFYFHQAFPSSAVFQSFYKRKEYLQSLLHSDLIGFHIWEYARNFINTCEQLLGLNLQSVGNTLSVNYNKRSIQVRIWHIGLDESFVQKILSGQKYELDRLKVANTIRNAAAREQNTRARVGRGNLNSLNNMRSASQPILIGQALNSVKHANSITSTLDSSLGENDSSVNQDPTQGKIILASIDSFHQMTGLILKLKGYYNFLKDFPEYRDKVVLFQVIRGLFTKSENMMGQHKQEESKQSGRANAKKQGTFWLFEEVESLKTLNVNVIKMVNKIRGEFGRQCLIVDSGNWTVSGRMALWSRANVLFVSTLKDGLYLTCFEYIFVKYLCNDFQNSAMILSEFTGCSSQFAGFYEFVPFQLKTTVAALVKCLKDSPEEKAARMKRAYQFCRQRTFHGWVKNFLKELKLANAESEPNVERSCLPIQMDIKKQAMIAVSHRKNLIMIDHEALSPNQLGRSEMSLRNQIIPWIQEILYDKNNIVVIMSDGDRNYVSSVFESDLMESDNFWVAAESGYWLKTNKKEWIEFFAVYNKQWMQTIRQIMEEYCENIDGTVVEERSCTVVWNYKNAENEHGSKSANELVQQLQQLLGRNAPVKIVHGNGFVEVLPKKLTKKAILNNILSNLQIYCNHQIESFLFIGADISENSYQYLKDRIDEDIHRSGEQASSELESRTKPLFAVNCKIALCVFGRRPSTAQFYLEYMDVQYLLKEMAFKTQSRKRTKSWTNLLDNGNTTGQESSSGYSQFQTTGNLQGDLELDFQENSGSINKKTPPRKNRLKGRHFSQNNLLQLRIDDRMENETIRETTEEDEMTQMSEFKQLEQDAYGIPIEVYEGYDGASSSIHKNSNFEQPVSRGQSQVTINNMKELILEFQPCMEKEI